MCILEWIDGTEIKEYKKNDLNQIIEFINEISKISREISLENINATDSCLNGNDIFLQIENRVKLLNLSIDKNSKISKFINNEFISLIKKIKKKCRLEFKINNIDFYEDLENKFKILSPVDVGFIIVYGG